jgi:hypothetical protein
LIFYVILYTVHLKNNDFILILINFIATFQKRKQKIITINWIVEFIGNKILLGIFNLFIFFISFFLFKIKIPMHTYLYLKINIILLDNL